MELFRNSQWAVTKSALKTVKPEVPYEIDISRLTETTNRSGTTYYDWPLHLAEKEWVQMAAFIEAFKKALDVHRGKYQPALDREMLDRSIAESQRMRARR